MIYQPSYPFPYNSPIDSNETNVFMFQVNGGRVSDCVFYIYNFYENTLAIPQISASSSPSVFVDTNFPIYGGHEEDSFVQIELDSNALNNLVNGNDYKWKVRLYQDIYDIWVSYGKTSNTVTVTSGNNTIKVRPHSNVEVGMKIKIKNKYYSISGYVIDSTKTFATITTNENFISSIEPNTDYQIYSNFIDSAEYYFKARTTPSISVLNMPNENTLSTNVYKFDFQYTQAENVSVKNYKFELRDENRLIDETSYIYSENIFYEFNGFLNNRNYILTLKIENEDGWSETFDYEIQVSYEESISYEFVDVTVKNNNSINIDWSNQLNIPGHPSIENCYELTSAENHDESIVDCVKIHNNAYIKWDSINSVPLNIPKDFTFVIQTNLEEHTNGVLFILDTDDGDKITVGYEDYKFYYKINSESKMIHEVTDSNGLTSIQFGLGNSRSVIDHTTYVWYYDYNSVWDESKQWIYNDIGNRYWWTIVVSKNKVEFFKAVKRTEL